MHVEGHLYESNFWYRVVARDHENRTLGEIITIRDYLPQARRIQPPEGTISVSVEPFTGVHSSRLHYCRLSYQDLALLPNETLFIIVNDTQREARVLAAIHNLRLVEYATLHSDATRLAVIDVYGELPIRAAGYNTIATDWLRQMVSHGVEWLGMPPNEPEPMPAAAMLRMRERAGAGRSVRVTEERAPMRRQRALPPSRAGSRRLLAEARRYVGA